MRELVEFQFFEEALIQESFSFESWNEISTCFEVALFPDETFVRIEIDRAQLRQMGRIARMLIWFADKNKIKRILTDNNISPDRTGLYGAIYSSEFPYGVYRKTLKTNDYADAINNDLHPFSLIFRSNALTSAHLSHFLSITGPTQTFTHKKWALVHALEQAKFDLENNKINFAVIFTAHAIKDDPLRFSTSKQNLNSECVLIAGFESINNSTIENIKRENWNAESFIEILLKNKGV